MCEEWHEKKKKKRKKWKKIRTGRKTTIISSPLRKGVVTRGQHYQTEIDENTEKKTNK